MRADRRLGARLFWVCHFGVAGLARAGAGEWFRSALCRAVGHMGGIV
jgi:hypothetical protein